MTTFDPNGNAPLPVAQWTDDFGWYEMWQFVATQTANVYQIQNPHSGQCVATTGTAVNNQIQSVTCNPTDPAQQWTGSGNANSLTLTNVGTKLCLDVYGQNPNAGYPLVQNTCSGSSWQHWAVTEGSFRSGYALVDFSLDDDNNALRHVEADILIPALPTPLTGQVFVYLKLSSYLTPGDAVEQVLGWGQVSCGSGPVPSTLPEWWVDLVSLTDTGGTCGWTTPTSVVTGNTAHVIFDLQNSTWNMTLTVAGQTLTYSQQLPLALDGLQFTIGTNLGGLPTSDIIFKNVVFTTTAPNTANTCLLAGALGVNDYVASGTLSADKLTCRIPQVTLRYQGVPATTVNP